jgi:hypothetical protein
LELAVRVGVIEATLRHLLDRVKALFDLLEQLRAPDNQCCVLVEEQLRTLRNEVFWLKVIASACVAVTVALASWTLCARASPPRIRTGPAGKAVYAADLASLAAKSGTLEDFVLKASAAAAAAVAAAEAAAASAAAAAAAVSRVKVGAPGELEPTGASGKRSTPARTPVPVAAAVAPAAASDTSVGDGDCDSAAAAAAPSS